MPNAQEYAEQLREKCTGIQQLLASYSPPQPSIYESPVDHFRMRAEFRVWHDNDECFYVMFPPGKKQQPYRVDEFPMATQTINRLMPALLRYVQKDALLRERLFQVEFLNTLAGGCLITLIYHKALNERWLTAAEVLRNELGVELVGRSRRQKLVLGKDYVIETLSVNGNDYRYKQVENSFTQPNARVNELMLQWAQDCTPDNPADLLELYCGNGNFSVALAQNFRKVLATEVNKSALQTAQFNAQENAIANITCARLSAAEVSQALHNEREFRRLQHIDLEDYDFRTVFVDPPRSGLDPATLAFVSEFKQIVYISCSPQSLANNLNTLTPTHDISAFAIFDQFPYTPHIESGVVLQVRDS
ncbi:MAG: tRNA (uridine(54)-C5)-methyltransferase TrmA [Pseudomonadales bacterium]